MNALKFLIEKIEEGAPTPNYQELTEHLGLASKSGAHRVIDRLIERGFVEKMPKKTRGIIVVKRPDGTAMEHGRFNTEYMRALEQENIRLKARIRSLTKRPADKLNHLVGGR